MKNTILLCLCISTFISCTSVEKRKAELLKQITELSSKPDHRVLSGQFIGWGKDASMKDIDSIYRKSGKWIGFFGADYHNLDYKRDHFCHKPIWTDISTTNKMILDYGVKFVFFCQHLNNPFTDSSAWDNTGDLKLLQKDGEPKRKLDAQLDSMAIGYKELEENGVIIFLRPLHEMNGGWFWWGNKDSTDFIALWKYIHEYYTVKKNLKNIIWCYSPILWPVKYLTWYPGSEYVDVVCLDVYTPIIHPYRCV